MQLHRCTGNDTKGTQSGKIGLNTELVDQTVAKLTRFLELLGKETAEDRFNFVPIFPFFRC